MNLKIGICGLGIVGNAMKVSLMKKGYILNDNLFVYDKFKEIGNINNLLSSDILFLPLPTIYDEKTQSYDLSAINTTLEFLSNNSFQGVIVIKSTVEPTTVDQLSEKYQLDMLHNPEFLTARTAEDDFHNQTHIVLGKGKLCNDTKFNNVFEFYKMNYDAYISICSSTEAETMKLFLNSFYAIKVQFFTELYLTCQKLNMDYNCVRELMLKNGWINQMHTTIPGPDGKISYGGLCFPKDTTALSHFMEMNGIPNGVLEATINERSKMRSGEDTNVIKKFDN